MKLPKKLTQGPIGNLFYALLGILIAVIFYYVILRFALATDMPMVAVVSDSMEHYSNPVCLQQSYTNSGVIECTKYSETDFSICGKIFDKRMFFNLDEYWGACGSWYEDRGIIKENFGGFPCKNGFDVGDMPIIRGLKEYKVGDVIVFSVPSIQAPIIHRIVKINDDGTYQTKGDNNSGQNAYESSVAKAQIHGKVIFVIPKLGYFKIGFNKLLGL